MDALRSAVIETAAFLEANGHLAVARRLRANEARLAAGDGDAIGSILSEATGGSGSLRDIYLYPENADDRAPLNAQLEHFIERIAELVRQAGSAAEGYGA